MPTTLTGNTGSAIDPTARPDCTLDAPIAADAFGAGVIQTAFQRIVNYVRGLNKFGVLMGVGNVSPTLNTAAVDATGNGTAPGVKATAGGSTTPARGAVSLVAQNTPSAPTDGDLWYDTQVARPRFAARVDGVASNTPVAVSTFQANWSGTLSYYKTPDGIVRLRGYATPAAGAGQAICSLPTGFRPPAGANNFVVWLIARRSSDGLTTAAVTATVSNTGVVSLDVAAVAAQNYYFDGMSFLAEA